MSTNRDIYLVDDIAERLGMSVAAVRQAIKRRSDAIPPWTKRGNRIVFKRQEYEQWLRAL